MSKRVDVSYQVMGDVEAVYAVISGDGWAAAKAKAFEAAGVRVGRNSVEVGDMMQDAMRGAKP